MTQSGQEELKAIRLLSRAHSRIQAMPASLWGTSSSPACGFHGAETNGLMLFLGSQLRKYPTGCVKVHEMRTAAAEGGGKMQIDAGRVAKKLAVQKYFRFWVADFWAGWKQRGASFKLPGLPG